MTKVRSTTAFVLLFALLSLVVLSGCQSTEGNVAGATVSGGDSEVPPPEVRDPASPNPNLLVIAVKYIALKDTAGAADSPARADVETMLAKVSSVWAQCDIAFFLAKYETAVADDYGIDMTPSSFSALREVRQVFDDGTYALVARVNDFVNSSELGTSNAYSTMPGSEPEGIVVEKVSQTSHMLMAHEFGHLIGGLGHTTGTNLMNHFVSPSNTPLTSSQCAKARATIESYHSRWLR